MPKTSYRSFLLRLWLSSSTEQQAAGADAVEPVCRASLEDVHTHEIISFANLEGLREYLQTNLLDSPKKANDPFGTNFSEEKS